MTRLTRRQAVGLAVLVILVVVVCALRMLIYASAETGLEFGWPDADVAKYRWTPLAVGITIGIALSVSGVVFQALLRNPLASPFILGVSSGAALGVIVAMYIGHLAGTTLARFGGDTGPALVGALAALGVVYALGQRRGWLEPVSLILVGVIVATICGAGIMLFQHLVPHGLRGDLVVWMMGHLPEAVGGATLLTGALLALAGLILAMAAGRAMDAATLGDEEARSVGLSLGRLRLGMFILAGALAAESVALAGPIGFVGLIAPHAARLVIGPRHTALVLGAALCGVFLVVGADTARQAITVGSGRIPIGVFTALIGGPIFLWLLRSGRGQA